MRSAAVQYAAAVTSLEAGHRSVGPSLGRPSMFAKALARDSDRRWTTGDARSIATYCRGKVSMTPSKGLMRLPSPFWA